MEERGNKTIMCSVLFLDIVEYSKKSVAGQISLKDRFNSYLSEAIRDVPMTDRIILDTGDGAAINFLGDVEDALKAALSLRESLLNEAPDVDHPLLVRMGINLGPVRLVRDINGQPNIVGDGINVAQRVMSFADVAQILVSRSYYDAVSRLSPQYAGMFHYQGSRTDKHVREHEVYAIGYPGDKTTRRGPAMSLASVSPESTLSRAMQHVKVIWHQAVEKLNAFVDLVVIKFKEAETGQRVQYIAAVTIPSLLLIALLTSWATHTTPLAKSTVLSKREKSLIPPNPEVVPLKLAPADTQSKAKEPNLAHSPTEQKKSTRRKVEKSAAKVVSTGKLKVKSKVKPADQSINVSRRAKTITKKGNGEHSSTYITSSRNHKSYISIACVEETEVFVDGISKGRIDKLPLTIPISPGRHTLIISNANKGIFTQRVKIRSGKTVHLKPNRCN